MAMKSTSVCHPSHHHASSGEDHVHSHAHYSPPSARIDGILEDDSTEGAQNCAKMEPNWKEELKEISCDHTQPTGDNCCHKLVLNDSPEGNISPSISDQVNGTTMHVLDRTERKEELCGPSIANSSNFPVLLSRQTSGYEKIQHYEQIQGYEKIQCYEKVQGYEKIWHCNVNLAQLVGKAHIESAANPASTLALSAQSNEDIQAQCHLADSCHEYKEHNLEISLTACKNRDIESITETNFEIESPVVPDDAHESEGLQENAMETCFKGSNSNLGGYERICHYERIEHCDVNLAHMLSPTIAKDVINTASSEQN